VGDAHRFIDPIYSLGLCVLVCRSQSRDRCGQGLSERRGRDDDRPFAAYELERDRGIDVVEDMMDAFWEYPFYFAKIVHDYRDEMIDIFAGRLGSGSPMQ
jgi:1H-pyrrole-2-carbonyl-[peptidyl-carrier protein] brominase